MEMSRRYAFYSASMAALLVLGMMPTAGLARTHNHAIHASRTAENAKTHSPLVSKDQDRQEHATTPVPNRNSVVSVGPQASAFRRIRDIAMAPTG